MKLLVLGIDAMDPRILYKNIDLFPNMKSLLENGCHASYDAYAYGYGSNDNWVSLYTGLKPKQHGVINNVCLKTNKTPLLQDFSDKIPFWEVLNENNIKVGMWKGLSTSPPKKILGYMVSGEYNFDFGMGKDFYDSINPVFIKEDEKIKKLIEGKLEEPLPPKRPEDYGYTWEDLFANNDLVDDILKDTDYYRGGFEYLINELDFYEKNIIRVQKEFPVDVIFFYTAALDLIQHFQLYDENKKIILESMKKIDEFIGNMINELKPQTVIVLSDHGASSFKEVLPSNDINVQKEAFGFRDNSIWLKNGAIVTKARTGGFLSGIHDIKGTFIVSGEGIKKGCIRDMRTIDFYPTLLEIFDIKVPKGRQGYVLNIFEDKTIVNKDKLLLDKNIKRKKIAIIQNIEVSEFNRTINEVFLDNRFSDITIFCEKKYANIFLENPRVNKVEIIEGNSIKFNLLSDYEEVYISYKNDATNVLDYIRVYNDKLI